jgi:AcrR family transcriptional regulator
MALLASRHEKNTILHVKNAILTEEDDDAVLRRVARDSLDRSVPGHVEEVRALLDAARDVMTRNAPQTRARVADIVATAGLSNDAFYRLFRSKDDLVTALLEDGTQRLTGHVARRMAAVATPQERIACWVRGIMSQTREEVAKTTLAVLANGGNAGEGIALGRHFACEPMAALMGAPLAELGSPDPGLDASLAAHAVLGKLSEYLWQRTRPTPAELDGMIRFCIATAARTEGEV